MGLNYKTSSTRQRIFAALPVMNESAWLPALFESLAYQKDANLELVACVNQPESYHQNPEKQAIVEDNRRCLQMIEDFGRNGHRVHIIDRSSPGKGWPEKKQGVGQARKAVMDYIASIATPDEIIVSIDADTVYPPEYFKTIKETLGEYTQATGLCVPYHHPLSGDQLADRCMLRYEIYMRAYALNLLLTGNPYAFTAIGSAMATQVKTYRKLGGLTPFQAGEDFYFIQKLAKNGPLLTWVPTKAYPAGRFSDRVIFGTGPAMIKGREGDWSSYPVYHPSLFSPVRQTFELFPALYKKDITTPMDAFFEKTYGAVNIWESLRNNARTPEIFSRACMQKVDGLRILQFLKMHQPNLRISDEESLNDLLRLLPEGEKLLLREPFSSAPIETLDRIRVFMEEEEYRIRRIVPVVNQKYFHL